MPAATPTLWLELILIVFALVGVFMLVLFPLRLCDRYSRFSNPSIS